MRILFVAPWIPSKVRPRSLGILKELAAEHEVWFIGQRGASERLEELHGLELAGITLVPNNGLAGAVRSLCAVFTGASLQASFVKSRAYRKVLRSLMDDFRPEAAHFNVIRSAAFLDDVGNVPVVFDLDEMRSEYYSQLGRHSSSPLWRMIGRVEAKRMEALERRVVRESEYTFVSSPVDLEPADERMMLLRSPHALELSESDARNSPSPDSAFPPVILFVGRMSYRANVEAVVSFVRTVMPRVRTECLGAELWIAGENPGAEIQALAGPDIRVMGFVDDLSALYRRADVSIVPVELGTGVQMKLIQSLASGVASVATTDAARRAGVQAEHHVLVADTAEEWADRISSLLNSPSLADKLALEGQAWFAAHYAPDVLYRSLRASYRGLAAQASEKESESK